MKATFHAPSGERLFHSPSMTSSHIICSLLSHMEFNLVDGILILVVLLSLYTGWRRGFLLGTMDLLVLIGSLVGAFFLYPFLAAFFEHYTRWMGVWTAPLAFIIMCVLVRLVLSAFSNFLLQQFSDDAHVHGVNRLLGLAPGFVKGLLYAGIVAALLLALPISDSLSTKTRESPLAAQLIPPVEWAESKLSPVFDDAIKRSMNKLTVEPNSHETVNLHFTVANPKLRPDLEAKMLVLVNEERSKAGLPPVQADLEMAVVARKHSKDMFAKGYFAHVNLEKKDPFDRMRDEGVRFLTAGENLALAQTLSLAHRGLMNSPGHRANILQKSFGRLGIGIYDGGIYGLMVTQNFRN